MELKARHYAAIKIQAFTRGSLQRIKFHRQLAWYREQERNRKLLEDYGRRVISDREASILQAVTTKISKSEILTTEEDRPGISCSACIHWYWWVKEARLGYYL